MCLPASALASYKVSLTRTTGGVANISGQNLGDTGYGVGYAQAQDGICLLAETFLTVDGERSAFLGPEGTFKNESEGGVVFTNLYSDLYWTSLKNQHTIQKLLRLPLPAGPLGRSARSGEGLRRRLRRLPHADRRSRRSHEPRVQRRGLGEADQAIDVWRRIYQIDDLAGNSALGPAAEANPAYGPPAPRSDEKRAQGFDAPTKSLAEMAQIGHSELLGSNGLAVGGEDATNGGGVVLSNPHFPWHGSERFWEMNVEVPGSTTRPARGSGGCRGSTSATTRMSRGRTLSRRTRRSSSGTCPPPGRKSTNGRAKIAKLKKHSVTVKALENGELVPRTGTLYYSNYGPVFWEGSLRVAVEDANANNLRGPDQWLAISKAENASQVIESERAIQGVPWVNTIGADDEGNAFYTEIIVASSLTKAFINSACNLEPGSITGPYIDNGACEAPESPGAITPGILAGSAEPSLVRRDYVANSNNSFWLANANSPLTGFSPALGGEEVNPGMRAQTGIDMVAQRMGTYNSGVPTDGISPTPGFTAETMQDSWTKFRSLPAERALPGLREICANAVSEDGGVINGVNVSGACPVLDAYGASATLEDRGRLAVPGMVRARLHAGRLLGPPLDGERPGLHAEHAQHHATGEQGSARGSRELDGSAWHPARR